MPIYSIFISIFYFRHMLVNFFLLVFYGILNYTKTVNLFIMKILIASEYPRVVIPQINQAKTNLDILMYHWGFYSHLSNCDIHKITLAIKSAISRGVPVRVLLHAGNPSDNLRHKNSETASHLQSWGANVKFFKSGGTMHAKLVLIDKTFAICGSHNFSKQSMASNIETSIMLEGSGDIRRLQEYFNLLWGHN